MAESQAFVIFHFKCYSILHFAICQLLCLSFLCVKDVMLHDLNITVLCNINEADVKLDVFRVDSLAQCLALLDLYTCLYKPLPSFREIFSPVVHFMKKLPLQLYPAQIKVCFTSGDIGACWYVQSFLCNSNLGCCTAELWRNSCTFAMKMVRARIAGIVVCYIS